MKPSFLLNAIFAASMAALCLSTAGDAVASSGKCKTFASSGDKIIWRYINGRGEIVLKIGTAGGGDFSEGLAWCSDPEHGKPQTWWTINHCGEKVFEVKCDWVPSTFSCGLALVHSDGAYSYINRLGQKAFAASFKDAESFENGVAEVTLPGDGFKMAKIDTTGAVIEHLIIPRVDSYFEPCSALVEDGSGRPLWVKSNFETDHGRRSHFSEGFAWVGFLDKANRHRLGYIDEGMHLAFALPENVTAAGDFHEGLAAVMVKSTELNVFGMPLHENVGFVDRTGKIAILPKFEMERLDEAFFSEGIAHVERDGLSYYIDRGGNVIGKFILGGDFHSGLARVAVMSTKSGKILAADDHSHGYQSQPPFARAWLEKLEPVASKLFSFQPFEFDLFVDSDNVVHGNQTMSSGDVAFDARALRALISVMPPRASTVLESRYKGLSLGAKRLQNGLISPALGSNSVRHARTAPTLPEGAPIPDNE